MVSYTIGTEPAVNSDGTSSGTQPTALIASRTELGGQTTTYGYDRTGNLTKTTSPSGLVTSYAYDNLGRLLTQTDNCTDCGTGLATVITSYEWDSLSNTLTRADPASTHAVTGTAHKREPSVDYDNDSNQTRQTISDSSGGDASCITTWNYNNNLVANSTDPAGRITTYTYDAYGNTTNKTDPAGTKWSYSNDALGHRCAPPYAITPAAPTDLVPSRFQHSTASTMVAIFPAGNARHREPIFFGWPRIRSAG